MSRTTTSAFFRKLNGGPSIRFPRNRETSKSTARTLGYVLTFLVATAMLPIGTGSALADDDPEQFFGSYVGSGTAEDLVKNEIEQRDLDVTIEAYKEDGFTLNWITVIRGSDGERAGDDVRRREISENFLPFEDRSDVFILAAKGGLFQRAELPNPLRGEPMRWATIKDSVMTVYSMAISEDGGSELQIYRRVLTEKGMDVSFMRMHNERISVKMDGTLVRTD